MNKLKPGNEPSRFQFPETKQPCCGGLNAECIFEPPLTKKNTAEHGRPVMMSASQIMPMEEEEEMGGLNRPCDATSFRHPTRLIGTKQRLVERTFPNVSYERADAFYSYQQSSRMNARVLQEKKQ